MIAAFRHRFDAGAALAVAGWLLVFVCTLLTVRIGWLLVDGVEVAFEPIEYEPARDPAALPAGRTDWRMFGDPVEPEYGLEQPIPKTPLALHLRGVVTGERGYAIIVGAGGNEGVYRVGDQVTPEARLVLIEPRRIVLERAGEREALELPGGGAAGRVSAITPRRSGDRPSLAAGVGIGSIREMASQFTLDPAELANRITILPVAGGGFRVRAGRDAAIFTQLGFHANDVVLAINGQPVDNRADVRAVFESYRPGEPLAITVRRGDRQLVLTPDLTNLEGDPP